MHMNKYLTMLIATSAILSTNSYAAPATKPVQACLTTNYGKIELQLDQAKAPLSVANFEQYVKSGFYKDKIFHRVIPNFMIQGGGFDKDMNQAATKAPIKNEANNGLKNDKYTIAMARTNDPDSATAQFFINVKDNDFLNYSPANPGYAVFGKVTKGQDVVDKIAAVKTGSKGMYQDVPDSPVTITNATLSACK